MNLIGDQHRHLHAASHTNERTTVELTMSVRKLALAIASRVNGLRERLIAEPQAKLRTMAMVGAAACVSGAVMPDTCSAQQHTSPIQDPFAFDPDFNWFEPIYQADFEDMKPTKRANRGWFAGYDRMMLYVSRPEGEPGETKLDEGWGNRYDLGFMTDDDNGWAMTYFDLNGPNSYDGFRRERLNRFNADQEIVVLGVSDGGDATIGIFPETDRNNPGYNTRFVEVRDSLNVMDFNSFELNKTWRLEPYHYGGMLEPLVGFRYMSLDSTFQDMNYAVGFFGDPAGPPLNIAGFGEQVTTQTSVAENDMFGGQVGFRYFKFQDRFRYSAELRVFTLGNFQCNTENIRTDTTIYDNASTGAPTVGIGDEPLAYIVEKSPDVYGRNEEFVFGFDIRSEVSYQITKMVEVRGGFQMIDLAQGIWRGRLSAPINRNDQQITMVGATFGITLNR